MNKKWYEKNLAIILLLIFFFPVGIFLMWRYSKWNKVAKIVISIFFGIVLIANMGSKKTVQTATTKTDTAIVQEQSKEKTAETVENTDQNKQTEIEQPKETKKIGWVQEKGNSYYYDNDGKTKTGWLKDNNKYYYLNASGIMQKGWIKDNEENYYCDNSGVMQTGWKESDGNWYYLNADGTMAANKTVDGFYLAANGAMQEKSISTSNTNSNSAVNSSSGGTQYVDESGNGLIKGSKSQIYHVPGSTYYNRTKNVARWFKTVEEAKAAGYRAPEK